MNKIVTAVNKLSQFRIPNVVSETEFFFRVDDVLAILAEHVPEFATHDKSATKSLRDIEFDGTDDPHTLPSDDTSKVRNIEDIPKGCAISRSGTVYHDIEEIYYRMEEGECLHMWLDDKKVPRADPKGVIYSLVGRVIQAIEFQSRVDPWMMTCFGPEISGDKVERNHRFGEEANELMQACGCTREDAHKLVDYVYDRPVGEPKQEVGGVMVTLAALCLAHDMNMHTEGETELARIWTKVDVIRAKQAAKPKFGPLAE